MDEVGQMRSGCAKFCGRDACGFDDWFVGCEQEIECGAAPGGIDAEDALVLSGECSCGVGAQGAATDAAFAASKSDNGGAIRMKLGSDVIQNSLSRRGNLRDSTKSLSLRDPYLASMGCAR